MTDNTARAPSRFKHVLRMTARGKITKNKAWETLNEKKATEMSVSLGIINFMVRAPSYLLTAICTLASGGRIRNTARAPSRFLMGLNMSASGRMMKFGMRLGMLRMGL